MLLFSLDTDDDPMFVLLIIDYFAIAEHYSKDGYVS